MPDRRSSRAIIWQHAFDYGWRRYRNIRGTCEDAFSRGNVVLAVRYSLDGRRVVAASERGIPMQPANRNGVMDALERRTDA